MVLYVFLLLSLERLLCTGRKRVSNRFTLTLRLNHKMKSKFQNLNFGSVALLSQTEQSKVKGGAYGAGPSGCGGTPTALAPDPNSYSGNTSPPTYTQGAPQVGCGGGPPYQYPQDPYTWSNSGAYR